MTNQRGKMNKKQELMHVINASEVQERIVALLNGNKTKAEKFKATLVNIALNDSLKDCTTKSIIKSAFSLAEVGIPLNQNLGLGYILTFNFKSGPKQAQAVISAKGWVYLAKEAGIRVKARAVYDVDNYSLDLAENGWDEEFKLKVNHRERKTSDRNWVKSHLVMIVISTMENGLIEHYPVYASKIFQLSKKGESRKYSPFVDWAEEMYTAKALGYVLRRKPMIKVLTEPVQEKTERKEITIEEVKPEIKKPLEIPVVPVAPTMKLEAPEPKIKAPKKNAYDFKASVREWIREGKKDSTESKRRFFASEKLEMYEYKTADEFCEKNDINNQKKFDIETREDYEVLLKADIERFRKIIKLDEKTIAIAKEFGIDTSIELALSIARLSAEVQDDFLQTLM